jgi:hypothetical protein
MPVCHASADSMQGMVHGLDNQMYVLLARATARSAKQALDALEQEHAAATARLTSGLKAATSTQVRRARK